ncbi:hypothetical protein HYDPIDRAFT_110787 [Hydnomerulius pinastri MD-312]|nr:hypothetical protein HYDPIDRAFT_110787 [Hydnomerulius pinastri MD-312]
MSSVCARPQHILNHSSAARFAHSLECSVANTPRLARVGGQKNAMQVICTKTVRLTRNHPLPRIWGIVGSASERSSKPNENMSMKFFQSVLIPVMSVPPCGALWICCLRLRKPQIQRRLHQRISAYNLTARILLPM